MPQEQWGLAALGPGYLGRLPIYTFVPQMYSLSTTSTLTPVSIHPDAAHHRIRYLVLNGFPHRPSHVLRSGIHGQV